MAEPASVADILAARARKLAAKAGFLSLPANPLEKPRDVILNCCQMIAASPELAEFAFLKSGPKLKRVDGDFTEEISFQSNHYNLSGERAAVWPHCHIYSKKLAKWRKSHSCDWIRYEGPQAGHVVSAHLGNLGDSQAWIEFDFADARTRQATVRDLIGKIECDAFPFFGEFSNPRRAISKLFSVKHYHWAKSVLEYAYVELGRDEATAILQSFFRRNPKDWRKFAGHQIVFAHEGLPRFRSANLADLAATAFALGLEISPPN